MKTQTLKSTVVGYCEKLELCLSRKIVRPIMETVDRPIYVTKPLLPELNEFIPYLEQIWESHQLTNAGPFHEKLERELAQHLDVQYVSLFANGTLGLLTALQALRIVGEVITTPFSFVATSHVLTWNRARPIFVDIDPKTFNLDPEKVEAAITLRDNRHSSSPHLRHAL